MSKEFLSRIMVKNTSTKCDVGVNVRPVNKETLGPLERTVYTGGKRVGQHPDNEEPVNDVAFSRHITTQRISGQEYLKAHQGLGATARKAQAEEVAQKKDAARAAVSPPKAGATKARPNPPNSELRRFYERGDLPVVVVQGTSKAKLSWKVPIADLDFHHYLPIFVSGLREVEEPYRFVAEEGVMDMLAAGGESKVLPVVPQIILPMKDALATRDEKVIIRTLRVLTALARLGGRVGQALVPYYRQLLPIVSLFAGKFHNIGDQMDFGQRKGHLSDGISECLQALEASGGPDAYINIKYVVPTYESAVLG